MWIAELAHRTSTSVATIKYYIREGLVPPGQLLGATRSRYDESHVHRLRLVRALAELGGLPLVRVGALISQLCQQPRALRDVLGGVHHVLASSDLVATPASRNRIDALIAEQRWRAETDAADRLVLASVLDALDNLGYLLDDRVLRRYAELASELAELDVEWLKAHPHDPPEAAVMLNALGGPLVLSLRHLAQQSAAAEISG